MSTAAFTSMSLREALPLLVQLAKQAAAKPIAERSEPFTLPEIAERWHTTPKAVERLCLSGRLASFKPAKKRLVRPVALVKFERELETGGNL